MTAKARAAEICTGSSRKNTRVRIGGRDDSAKSLQALCLCLSEMSTGPSVQTSYGETGPLQTKGSQPFGIRLASCSHAVRLDFIDMC